jgi:hypothetical protein
VPATRTPNNQNNVASFRATPSSGRSLGLRPWLCSIGGAIARAYAAQGARLFLAGRTRATLAAVAGACGAEIAEVDALDERAVDEHGIRVVTLQTGGIPESIPAAA